MEDKSTKNKILVLYDIKIKSIGNLEEQLLSDCCIEFTSNKPEFNDETTKRIDREIERRRELFRQFINVDCD